MSHCFFLASSILDQSLRPTLQELFGSPLSWCLQTTSHGQCHGLYTWCMLLCAFCCPMTTRCFIHVIQEVSQREMEKLTSVVLLIAELTENLSLWLPPAPNNHVPSCSPCDVVMLPDHPACLLSASACGQPFCLRWAVLFTVGRFPRGGLVCSLRAVLTVGWSAHGGPFSSQWAGLLTEGRSHSLCSYISAHLQGIGPATWQPSGPVCPAGFVSQSLTQPQWLLVVTLGFGFRLFVLPVDWGPWILCVFSRVLCF